MAKEASTQITNHKELAEDSGSGFVLNPATLRSQFFTLFDYVATSPKELQCLTGHRSIRTPLENYVQVSGDRKLAMKAEIMRAWNTGPRVWVTPLLQEEHLNKGLDPVLSVPTLCC